MSLVVIAGHPRSGTTILRIVINSHPNLAITNEFGPLLPIGKRLDRYVLRILRRWWSIKGRRDIFAAYARAPSSPWLTSVCTLRYLRYLLRHRPTTAIGPVAVEAGLRHLFPTAAIVGDKYPDYVYSLDRFSRNPHLTCLVIYRDVRDVVASTLEKARTTWRGKRFAQKVNTAEKVARRWVEAIETMERNAGRIHVVRYETLVRNPQPDLQAIGELLSVDPQPFPGYLIRDSSIGRYRQYLTGMELETVLAIAAPTAQRLEYL